MLSNIIIAVLFLTSGIALACDGDHCESSQPKKNECVSELTDDGPGEILFVPSGRSPVTDKAYLKVAEKAAEVAHKLGYSVPPHQIIMAPSKELVGMVPVGGYAAPHHTDGQKVVEGAASSSGVMEFVVDGCPTCRSFNRDTTSLMQQISINLHVIGHNDFGKNSYFQQSRPDGDAVAYKYELAQFMRELYSTYDHDEVSMFYQLLESLNSFQDYARGSYDAPDKLALKGTQTSDLKRITAKRKGLGGEVLESPYEAKKFPEAATASPLQALVANFPPGTPQWKIKLANLYEKSHNMFPTVVQQKIANEGWATFSQYLVAKHLEGHNDHPHLFEYSHLLKGVSGNGVQISNPYWLGLECWKRIYDRFRKQPDIKALESEFEKDKAFVAHAHTYMATLDDYAFIKKALDEQWVRTHMLHLKRPASAEELQQRGIQVQEGDQFELILSISADRIIEAIARAAGDKRKWFPRIKLVDLNHRGKEILYDHEVYENLPLERYSTAQLLFILSFIQEKPVSLDTIASAAWLKDESVVAKIKKQLNVATGGSDEEILDELLAGMPEDQREKLIEMFGKEALLKMAKENPNAMENLKIRITAFPDGTVKVYELPDEVVAEAIGQQTDGDFSRVKIEESWLNAELTAQLQAGVDFYKEDLLASVNGELAETLSDSMSEKTWSGEWVQDIVKKIVAQRFSTESSVAVPEEGITSAAATASDAILEYRNMLETRLAKAIQDAITGQGKMSVSKNGVRVRARPVIPQLQHDNSIYGMLMGQKVPGPLDDRYSQMATYDVGVDDASDLGQGPGMPGDIRKLPPPQQGEGEGEGEGEGQPQPADPSEEEPDDISDADDAMDPSVVEIPLELWAEILNQHLELPNPRSTVGGMKKKDIERAGIRTRDGEPVVTDKTVEEALRWAIANHPEMVKPRKGETPKERMERIKKLFVEGLKNLPPEEYKIKSWQDTMEPDYKAVVVFVLDLSGSMQGAPIQKSKEFIYNVVSFLRSKYPQVELRFVGYDTQAHEFPESKIFRTGLGGATDDSVGYELANEILDEYNPREYNMYVYGSGDGGGFKVEETIEQLEKLYSRVQHMGFVENQLGWTASPDLLDAIKEMAGRYGYFDYGVIDQDQNSVMRALHEFFGKGKRRD